MVKRKFSSIYLNPRMAALIGLGFAAGLPYQLAQETLAAWLSAAGVDVATIGLFALVALPYSLKFLWAPVMDRFVPPLLGRRRGWLVITQLALMAAIITMAAIGPDMPLALAGAALVVAFLSASQDIVADAYRTDVLPRAELGAGAAVFVMGYRAALIVSGAGVLMLVPFMGWRMAFVLMGMIMAMGAVFSLAAPEPQKQASPPSDMQQAVIGPLVAFIRNRAIGSVVALALFVLLFKLPDLLAGRMTMPFLIQELKFSPSSIGSIRQGLGMFITILGTLAGGLMVARLGLFRSLVFFGILQAVSNAGFLVLAWLGHSMMGLVIVIAIESFCGGLVTAGFIAFLMSQCDPRYSATQYALLTSLMALVGITFGAVTGFVVKETGYFWFFAITIAAGVPALLLIPWLPEGYKPAAEEGEDVEGESEIGR